MYMDRTGEQTAAMVKSQCKFNMGQSTINIHMGFEKKGKVGQQNSSSK